MHFRRGFIGKAIILVGTVVATMMFPNNVFAGGDPETCGNNVIADHGGTNVYIMIEDDSVDISQNKINDYGESGTPPWDSFRTEVVKLEIDYGLYTIGENAFEGMTNLTTIYIPDSVKEIKNNAFMGCSNISTIYYGGTEEEWYKLSHEVANNSSYNNYFVYASNVICLDKGALNVNLTDGDVNIQGDDLKAYLNTTKWLYDIGELNKQEEPLLAYDLDKDGTNDVDFFVNGISNYDFRKSDGASLANYSKPFVFDNYKDKLVQGKEYKKYLYDYCLSTTPLGGCMNYYSSISFFFQKNLGAYEIDLRSGNIELSTTDTQLFGDFLSIARDGYYSIQNKRLIDYSVMGSTYFIDVNMDGIDDIQAHIENSKIKLTDLKKIKENTTVSFAEDASFLSFLNTSYANPYYSSVRFKFKDDLAKVDKVPATCEGNGTEAFWQSTDNDHIYSDEKGEHPITAPVVINKLGHDWGDWKTVKEATVDEEGTEERVCKRDSSHKESRAIPKLTPAPTPTPAATAAPTPAAAGTDLMASESKEVYKVTSEGKTDAADPSKNEMPAVEYSGSTDEKATNIIIPDTITIDGVTYKVESVSAGAFRNNKKITSVTIGKNVKVIGKYAFAGCTSLKKVNCKSKVLVKIGANAFQGDKKLNNFILKSTKLTKKNIGNNAFKGTSKKLVFKVPKKAKKNYGKFFKTKGNKKVKVK